MIAAERDSGDVSIQEMTDRADVRFGSFHNHFGTKAELSDAAVAEVLAEHGRLLDGVSAGVEDPAEAFAVGLRATARVAEDNPAMAQILVRAGLDYPLASDALAPRALRDIEGAVAARRFHVATPFAGLATTTGCRPAHLHVRLHAPDRLGHETADQLAEHILRMLGCPRRRRTRSPTAPCRRPCARKQPDRGAGTACFRDSTPGAAHLPS